MQNLSVTFSQLMKPAALFRCAIILAGSLFATVAVAQQTQYSHGDPTALEQQMLELVNRARANPTREGILLDSVNTWYSVDARGRKPSFFANLRGEFAAYPAVAPLAFNPKLIQAARGHSQDMVTRNFFAHVNPSGQDPTARTTAAGYDVGVGENIDGGGATSGDDVLMSHFAFMVDFDNLDTSNPIGHRQNVLNSTYSEIGIGISGPRYGGKLTQNFGAPARSYILGVAYLDANVSGSFEAGEGLAGITVTPDSGTWFAITSTSGGFAIPVDPVQTVSDSVNVPFAVQGNTWAAVQPYDAAYRQQQLAAAPDVTVNLTWSGGALSAPKTTAVTMKRPVLRNYKIIGTDGWYYIMSMVTTQNAKADLTPATSSIAPPKVSAPLRDFNGDHIADLLFQNNVGQIALWKMNGSGFSTGSTYLSTTGLGDWKLACIADMNGDGIADVLFQNNAGQVAVWSMSATGAVTTSAYLYSGSLGDWRLKASADINSDGNADLIFQNSAGQIAVWYMNGRGSSTSTAYLSTAALGDWRLACAVDINGDGDADLIFQNNAGQIAVWYMNGRGSYTGTAYLSASGLGDWKLAGSADINGDGNADLIFQNNAGQVAVWYMNGRSSYTSSAYLYSGSLGEWRVR